MPKFKVGDHVTFTMPSNVYKVISLDDANQMYQLTLNGDVTGFIYNDSYVSTDLHAKLVTMAPNTLPPFSQALANSGINTPPVVKKEEKYTGKLYKVMESIMPDGTLLKSGVILKVIGQSFKYHGEYELQIYDQPNSKVVTMHPRDTYWTKLKEYTQPKCSCGMDSTWQANHKKPAPKHVHSSWCDVSKE